MLFAQIFYSLLFNRTLAFVSNLILLKHDIKIIHKSVFSKMLHFGPRNLDPSYLGNSRTRSGLGCINLASLTLSIIGCRPSSQLSGAGCRARSLSSGSRLAARQLAGAGVHCQVQISTKFTWFYKVPVLVWPISRV